MEALKKMVEEREQKFETTVPNNCSRRLFYILPVFVNNDCKKLSRKVLFTVKMDP